MTDRERAIEYIRIFANVGDRWRSYAPVDAEPTPTGIRIGTVEIGRGEDETWLLIEGTSVSRFKLAVR